MFAYCGNNPVRYADDSGYWPTWDEFWDGIKEAFDVVVQGGIEQAGGPGVLIIKQLHYNRNILNETPPTMDEVRKAGYVNLPLDQSVLHQFNQKNGDNLKFVSLDGHYEVVYYSDGTINDTPEDMGTFNCFFYLAPEDGNQLATEINEFVNNVILHGQFDVIPYIIWGNSPEDSTTIIDRVTKGLG